MGRAVAGALTVKATSRLPADSGTVEARQTIETLPPKILRDLSMGDALNSLTTHLSMLDHLPAIGTRASPR
jgi:hypothetical protein